MFMFMRNFRCNPNCGIILQFTTNLEYYTDFSIIRYETSPSCRKTKPAAAT